MFTSPTHQPSTGRLNEFTYNTKFGFRKFPTEKGAYDEKLRTFQKH